MIYIKNFLYNLLSPFVGKRIRGDSENARESLIRFSPPPSGTCTVVRKQVEIVYDLEVIIPAFNAEKDLSECLDSVLNQETGFSYHVIVVDDGSTDSTSTILNGYKSERLSVIRQENGGTAKARNTGIENAHGRYIMFVDADDSLPKGTFEVLLSTAFRNSSDIVEGSADYTIKNRRFRYYSHENNDSDDFKAVNACIWGKIFSSSMFDNFCFPNGFWYEDTADVFLLFRRARKVSTCSQVVYLYRNNPYGMTSITRTKPKALDTYWVTELCIKEYYASGFPFDHYFAEQLAKQLIVNYKRMSVFGKSIQKQVFLCTCTLIEKFKAPIDNFRLFKIIEERDFGRYRLYCLLN